METSRRIGSKIIQIIKTKLNISDPPLKEPLYYSPTPSLEEINNENNIVENNSFSGDSIIIERSEYEKIKHNLETLKNENKESKNKEDEYKRLLSDFDTTLSFILEKDERENFSPLKKTLKEKERLIEQLNMKLDRYERNSKKLKEHLACLEKDLINSEERLQAYKSIAMEKIEILTTENNNLKRLYENEKMKNRNVNERKIEIDKGLAELEEMVKSMSIERNELDLFERKSYEK